MEPGNPEHGRLTSTAGYLLSDHVRTTGSGVTYGAETGFVLAEDTVRAPDAAYVSNERAEAVGRTEKFWPGAPDFAIEVVSPSDRPRAVASKARSWLDARAGRARARLPFALGDRVPRRRRHTDSHRRRPRPERRRGGLACGAGRLFRLRRPMAGASRRPYRSEIDGISDRPARVRQYATLLASLIRLTLGRLGASGPRRLGQSEACSRAPAIGPARPTARAHRPARPRR